MKNFGLYCITDNRANPLEIVKNWIACQVPIIQFRNKEMDNKTFADMAWEIRKLTWDSQTKFIINDRYEIAKDVDADGLHLGPEDLPGVIATVTGRPIKSIYEIELEDTLVLRNYLLGQQGREGNHKILGLSSHSYEEAIKIASLKPDYMSISPIFSTPTKPEYTPVGPETVTKVIKEINDPEIAILTVGDVNSENLEKVLATGIKNVAMVRAVNTTDLETIKNLITKLR